MEAGNLRATADFSVVEELDTVNICVPTPLRKTKDPDMSYVVSASQEIARYFHAGMLVILESTTYPGNTDELVLPMLTKSGLEAGRDFFRRVEDGYKAIAAAEPGRVLEIDSTQPAEAVTAAIWRGVAPLLEPTTRLTSR